MSEHSKEPWRVGPGSWVVSDQGVNPIVGADDPLYGGGCLVAESVCEADGRRIVACVNACAGIPTEELEMLLRAGKVLTAHGGPR